MKNLILYRFYLIIACQFFILSCFNQNNDYITLATITAENIDCDNCYQELFEKVVALQMKYPNQMVAGTMMAQALRIYKSTLKDDDFKSMIETIVESESKIQPYDKPTLN